MQSRDPKTRFSDRVADYIKYRPSYPEELIDFLEQEAHLQKDDVVADVGSGTGKLTELFLKRGWTTLGIEPNREMREAASALLSDYPKFQSIDASAENLSLHCQKVQLLTIAQAFHWVDADAFRREAANALNDHGKAALIWNSRRNELPFMGEYHQLLIDMVPEYELTREKSQDQVKMSSFFGHQEYIRQAFPYRQTFDWDGLKGRLMSASYCPKPDDPMHDSLMAKLLNLFHRYEEDGQIAFEYETVVYLGSVLRKS